MHPLGRVVARRVLWLLPTLFGLVVLTFIIAHVIPSDPAALVVGDAASPAQIAAMRVRLGLDRPLPAQFMAYLASVASGDLGTSLFTGRPIARDLLARLAPTLELSVVAMSLATLGGVPLGVLAARRHRTWVDHLIRLGTVAGFAIAGFWLALMLQLLFSMQLDWFPLSGPSSVAGPTGVATLDGLLTLRPAAFLDGLRHVTLPAVALALPIMATLVRFARAGMLEALASPALLYQRAMGVLPRVSVWKYALRHALIAVVTQAGLSFGVMLAGSVVIETIFGWPGVGNYAYVSIIHSDYPAVMGFVLWSGAAFVLVNFVIDLLLTAVDPRARA